MNEKLKLYIKENLEKENKTNMFKSLFFNRECAKTSSSCLESVQNFEALNEEKCDFENDVHNFININKDENNFQKTLFKLIDDRELKDSDVYNKVHIDRRLFSKIRNDSDYHPSRETVILLGLSLELNEKEIDNLLNSASYSLAKNNYYDLIIRFYFVEGIYKIKDVNDLLMSYNCKLFNY